MTLKIFGFPQSNTVRSTLITASEKGVAYELIEAMPHSPEIVTVNPLGKVPGMQHGSLTLGESVAICRYIDSNFEGPALLPDHPTKLATVEQFVAYAATALDTVLIRQYVLEYLFNKDASGNVDRTTIDNSIPKIAPLLKVFSDAIETNGFIASPVITLADCLAYPSVAAARMYPESSEALEPFDALNDWLTRMESRDSVSTTSPPR